MIRTALRQRSDRIVDVAIGAASQRHSESKSTALGNSARDSPGFLLPNATALRSRDGGLAVPATVRLP